MITKANICTYTYDICKYSDGGWPTNLLICSRCRRPIPSERLTSAVGHPHGLLVRGITGCECRPAASGTPEIIEYAIQRSSTDSLFFHDHDIVILLYWPSMFVRWFNPDIASTRAAGEVRMQTDAPALSVSVMPYRVPRRRSDTRGRAYLFSER